MRVLFIYRHPDMGYSIGKVFRPIETEMKKYAEVVSVYMPVPDYSIKGLWKNITVARDAVKNNHYDIVHITGTEHYLIPFLCGENIVVTVHDLGHLFNLHGLRRLKFWFLQVYSLKFAKAVTCISDFTVQELNKAISIATEKVHVIPNEIGADFVLKKKIFNETSPVVLHIGTRPHKNLSRTIKALKDIDCRLRIIGDIPDSDVKLLEKYNVIYSSISNLSDRELIEEYYRADIINFPSLHEGFGMPIIEGQVVGRLVITSDMEPMKSIAGEGAILCNPYETGSIRNAYLKGINDRNYRESIIKSGLENVEKYRLENITKQYLELYKLL
ncbi:MAG: glycosyltransferase family 4 protein [Prevotella sp.]|nr:glycosyltransferase family 4 protein [Prevotella sp.]